MNESRFVLDTNAVIALIDGKTIPPEMRTAFDAAELFISVITELELYAKKTMTAAEESAADAFIAGAVSVVNIDAAIKKTTIALRRSTALKLPDAVIAATSIVSGAVLLTNDSHLLRLNWPGLVLQRVF
jgi:predicted nucleic acid-binding protein